MINGVLRERLLASTIIAGALIAAAPAFAQAAPSTVRPSGDQTGVTSSATADETANGADIVVTGTIFRRTNTETPSPVTVLNADALQKRGITNVQEAIQRLSANGAGTLPNAFSPTGFASGASGASLRGLTTSSTLVLFDGLRAAYYPLADDGSRNFVDLNSIPDAIVDRVEVLKDGASSTYGADAVAGVINIITKKQITGFQGTISGGTAQSGGLNEQRISATYGYGDLAENGFNIYVSGEYQHDSTLYARDLDAPYNNNDFSGMCGVSLGSATVAAGSKTCRTNNNANGIQFDGTFAGLGTTIVPVVRAYNAANTAAVAGSQFQLLNPSLGCQGLDVIALTAAQQAANPTVGSVQCRQDTRNNYFTVSPGQQRIGGSAHLTVNVGDHAQAYAQFNFYQSRVDFSATPQSIRASTPAGGPQYTAAQAATIALPVYVCAARVNCTAANGTLNPNNPYAALGQTARIAYLFGDIPRNNLRKTNSYRGAAGINGSFGDDTWNYSVEGVGMEQDLRATYNGAIYLQHLLDVVADGSYNFRNPASNSQAIRNYIAPQKVNNSKSKLYQIQGSLSRDLFDLPGGPLQVGGGAAFRYESVISPSANPVSTIVGNPVHAAPLAPGSDPGAAALDRYNSTINPFGTSGSRRVYSGYFEVNAPILDQLEVNGSGRYDKYSSGQKNFSPKIGAKFTPIKEIAVRGTYSRGFRIPSFAEAFGLPTTGYVTSQVTNPAFLAAHQNDAYATGTYSYGLTSTGNPSAKPEKSESYTGGIIVEPIPRVSVSVDYYHIKKKNLITAPDYSQVPALYYANNGVVNIPGLNVLPGAPDVLYPNALPQLGFIEYSYINADSQISSGIDFDVEVTRQITDNIKLTSSLEANYVIELSQTVAGKKQRYDGTLGPDNITSASGTPKWRGSWQNTVDFGVATLSATVYYTKGYGQEAEDIGGIRNNCLASLGAAVAVYRDGVTPVRCNVKKFIDVDLTGSIRVNDQFTLFGNVLNAFNNSPPYDPGTYGSGSGANSGNYNPAWAQAGIVGRYFKIGARVNF